MQLDSLKRFSWCKTSSTGLTSSWMLKRTYWSLPLGVIFSTWWNIMGAQEAECSTTGWASGGASHSQGRILTTAFQVIKTPGTWVWSTFCPPRSHPQPFLIGSTLSVMANHGWGLLCYTPEKAVDVINTLMFQCPSHTAQKRSEPTNPSGLIMIQNQTV